LVETQFEENLIIPEEMERIVKNYLRLLLHRTRI